MVIRRAPPLPRPHKIRAQELSDLVSDIREFERERVARELHDGVLQSLVALKIKLENALQATSGPFASEISESIAQLYADIGEVRAIARNELPPRIEGASLRQAIALAVESFTKRHSSLDVVFRRIHVNDTFDSDVTWGLFRILQESLNNAAQHARATRIIVTLTEQAGSYELTVTDDGIGIGTNARLGRRGIVNMLSRAADLGGTLTFESNEGSGTMMRVAVPTRPRTTLESGDYSA